jgi:uncharacterized membrane protein YfcA
MSTLTILGLLMAGIGGGLTGSVAGLASVVSYPALLAVGLTPVTANVTNTVALICSSIGSVSGSLPELRGQATRMRMWVPVAVAGGLLGGVLLLITPHGDFKRVVPWLIGLASLGVLVRRSEANPDSTGDSGLSVGTHRKRWNTERLGLTTAIFVVGVYSGYFGAAAGVVLLALLLVCTSDSLSRVVAAKNLILGAANGVAALLFIFAGPVRWSAAAPLAIGLFIGGRLGPSIVRRTPTRPLQILIALAGIGLAGYLGLQAYA